MINTYITELVNYGIEKGLIDEQDRIYTVNRLIELFELDEYTEPDEVSGSRELHLILEDMTAWAFEHGVMKSDTIASKDLFDTKFDSFNPETIISGGNGKLKSGQFDLDIEDSELALGYKQEKEATTPKIGRWFSQPY